MLLALLCTAVLSSCASTLGAQTSTRTIAGREIAGNEVVGGELAATGGTSGASVTTPGRAGSAGRSSYGYGVAGLTEGITESTVKIGIPTIANAEAVTGLLGAADLQLGNPDKEAAALVADLNARGGINGRKVEAVYAPVDYANPNIEAAYLAACNKLTDDAHVFAILLVLNPPPSFIQCAAQHGTLLINASIAPGNDKMIAAAAPWYYAPTLISLTRVPAPLFDSGLARGKLSRNDKVGILALDEPSFTDTVEDAVKPALEARKIAYSYERVATEASLQNAVLRFQRSGVTHVFFEQMSGIVVLLFMRQAESQSYRPKYLLTSYDDPGYLIERNVAKAQLENVSGIGWAPLFDVDASTVPSNDLEKRCLSVIAKGGERAEDRQSFLTLTLMCELVWSFEAIAGAAGKQLSTVSFRTAYTQVGKTYRAVTALATDFSKRIDGVSGFRPFEYVASCGCLNYSGPLEQLP